jgi:hypothetical protein
LSQSIANGSLRSPLASTAIFSAGLPAVAQPEGAKAGGSSSASASRIIVVIDGMDLPQ